MALEARVRHLVVVGSACQTGVTGLTGTGGAGAVAGLALVGVRTSPDLVSVAGALTEARRRRPVRGVHVRHQREAALARRAVVGRGTLARRTPLVAHVAVVAGLVEVRAGGTGASGAGAGRQRQAVLAEEAVVGARAVAGLAGVVAAEALGADQVHALLALRAGGAALDVLVAEQTVRVAQHAQSSRAVHVFVFLTDHSATARRCVEGESHMTTRALGCRGPSAGKTSVVTKFASVVC